MGPIDRRDSTPQLLNRLRMRQIALLLAVDECSTLRAAADQMGLTQPAATKMLAELESALGQRLFDRVGRGRAEPGRRARARLFPRDPRQCGGVEPRAGELQLGSAGRLAIGSIMAASPGRLTEALVQLKARYPLLAIDIAVDTSDRLMPQLREGVLEVVIGRHVGTDCDFRVVDDEALAIIAGRDHPLAGAGCGVRRAARLHVDPAAGRQPGARGRRARVQRAAPADAARAGRNGVDPDHDEPVDRSTMLGVIPLTVAQRNAEHGASRSSTTRSNRNCRRTAASCGATGR